MICKKMEDRESAAVLPSRRAGDMIQEGKLFLEVMRWSRQAPVRDKYPRRTLSGRVRQEPALINQ